VLARDPPEFGVHDRDQFVESRGFAITPSGEKTRYVLTADGCHAGRF
jgi:hypothetical protein